MVGINVDNIVNKEGVLDNGEFFPKNDDVDINTINDIEYGTTEKKGENIKMELIKISEAEENNKERNYLLWKKDKEFFEFDIPTFLEMIKKENDQMTVGDIKNMLYKNLEKINNEEEKYLNRAKTYKN